MSGKRAKSERRKTEASVRDLMLGFVQELRRILKRLAPEHYERFPDSGRPCHTCAFNPATDGWKGMETTALALQKAIASDEPFYCHEPLDRVPGGWRFDPAKARLCAGYAVVVGDPDTKRAFVRSVRPGLTDEQADLLAGHVARHICEIPG